MMINVTRIGDSLTGSYNGISFGVSYDEQKYQKMLELAKASGEVDTMDELNALFAEFQPLTVESYKELVESKTEYLMVNKHTNKFFLRWQQIISSIMVPQALVDRVIDSVDKKIPIRPLIKCWVRLLRNPVFSHKKAALFAAYINKLYTNQVFAVKLMEEEGISREVALQRATTTQVSITEEGLLGTYKVSKEVDWKYILDPLTGEKQKKPRYEATIDDVTGLITYKIPEYVEDRIFMPTVMGEGGDEFFCGDKKGHIIKVGQWHYLEREDQIDARDGVSGVKGLHCGGLDYIKGFQNAGTVTHNTLVDPMDIRAFTDDGTGAIRVKRYFTQSSFAGVNRGIYHSSKIAAFTDLEFEDMVKKVVSDTEDKQVKLGDEMIEKAALKM